MRRPYTASLAALPYFYVNLPHCGIEMNFTDTHCHLADAALRENLPHILTAARKVGVKRFIVPATCPQDWQSVAELSEMPSEHGQIRIALGIHPWFSDGIAERDCVRLEAMLARYPQAWVGEIGLDFYDKTQTPPQRERQIQVFVRQLAIAQTLRRRVIIHNLKATADIAAAVKQTGFAQGGIVHAFSGSAEEARVLTKLGFKIGIGSLLLNPNARKVRDTLKALNDGDFVLETDSPFMLKKEINTPANILWIAEIAAQIRGVGVADIAAITERNADSLLRP
ncbi:putative deoxyribonuclease [Neisseria meningitidis]|uniref:Deoxyribonuclease n=3 Tax=Neisseria meningitidis TaxID=487 RepID=A0AB33TUA0_NEIME|nr:putative deoxyribonuclease [Neisseria meningitidis alpha275]CWN28262.1 putative deoxyribonuclease [Neisseria meningitidis]CWO49907.1 putative deoxyribonuclease [Neisseria meningitidis]CWO85397.1 putative deoxyribonuclease [Neisseria meningitidis]CWP06618.1 putative deoxyribonuclease [Neisseria meningitidis]